MDTVELSLVPAMASFEESKQRKADIVVASAEKVPDPWKGYVVKAAPVLGAVGAGVELAMPYVSKAYDKGLELWELLQPYHPEDMACVFFGLFMCFFGGEFPALITAIEAYRQVGFEPTWRALKILKADFDTVKDASLEDDKKDEDGDGVADVRQISASDLVERKALLFLRTSSPETTTEAIQSISAGALAVVASLKVSFARAITLGGAIGDVLRKPALRYAQPVLKKCIDEDYHKWIVPGITYVCKSVAISIAWTIQRVISAFHSAVRGGQLAGKGVVHYLHKYGFIDVNEDDTYADEAVGYGLAVAGLLMQISMGFKLPFPLNVLLLPLRMTEWAIVWTIMD